MASFPNSARIDSIQLSGMEKEVFCPIYEGLSEYLTDVELGAHVYNNYKDDPSWR